MGKEEVNHGLSKETCDILIGDGFEPRVMTFYSSRGQKPDGSYDNFVDKIECMAKHIASHMGGNYGLSDEYIVVNSSGEFKLQYYGDSSAELSKIRNRLKLIT